MRIVSRGGNGGRFGKTATTSVCGKDVAMSQVNGIGPADGPRKILGDSLRRMAKVAPPVDAPIDKVEISPEAREMVAMARQRLICATWPRVLWTRFGRSSSCPGTSPPGGSWSRKPGVS